MARRGMAWHGKASHTLFQQWSREERRGKGRARLGRAWLGAVWHGFSHCVSTGAQKRGPARPGKAGRGRAWRGYTHSIPSRGAEVWLKNQPQNKNTNQYTHGQ